MDRRNAKLEPMPATPLPATSFPKDQIKVLLLEGIHSSAVSLFRAEGFQVETDVGARNPAELVHQLEGVHVLGIRSRTQVTADLLRDARRLLAVGCFCIGTNQVDLRAANALGIPVFNAPFSNTRSVAELILAEIIMLARQLGDRLAELRMGAWRKVASGCHEVRGKTLGIVGYGHIGAQVGVLAEAIGMRVVFFDVAHKLPMGNNTPLGSLGELLQCCDFVSLHVPETPQTLHLIGQAELSAMKPGAYLLNASRGSVVDLDALADVLARGHIAGAGIDVFPDEPEGFTDSFRTQITGLPNVVMTPHIGGSTMEAQAAIGTEVASALTKFVNSGSTVGAVNFPQAELPKTSAAHRILNVHRNVPGVLRDINKIVSDLSANVRAQVLATDSQIGYLIMDLDQDVSRGVKASISRLDTSIRTRILY